MADINNISNFNYIKNQGEQFFSTQRELLGTLNNLEDYQKDSVDSAQYSFLEPFFPLVHRTSDNKSEFDSSYSDIQDLGELLKAYKNAAEALKVLMSSSSPVFGDMVNNSKSGVIMYGKNLVELILDPDFDNTNVMNSAYSPKITLVSNIIDSADNKASLTGPTQSDFGVVQGVSGEFLTAIPALKGYYYLNPVAATAEVDSIEIYHIGNTWPISDNDGPDNVRLTCNSIPLYAGKEPYELETELFSSSSGLAANYFSVSNISKIYKDGSYLLNSAEICNPTTNAINSASTDAEKNAIKLATEIKEIVEQINEKTGNGVVLKEKDGTYISKDLDKLNTDYNRFLEKYNIEEGSPINGFLEIEGLKFDSENIIYIGLLLGITATAFIGMFSISGNEISFSEND